MLKLIEVSSTQQKEIELETFDPKTSTWVVSDLKSKLFLQQRLLQKHKALPLDSILRVSELWLKMSMRFFPEVKVVSKVFAIEALRENLARRPEVKFLPGEVEVLYQVMSQFSGVFLNPDGFAMIGEWFRENPWSFDNWGKWYLEAKTQWDYFSENKLVSQDWLASYLAHGFKNFNMDRSFVFDLGGDLKGSEAEIVLEISKINDVRIFFPKISDTNLAHKALKPYDLLNLSPNSQLIKGSSLSETENSKTFLKALTQLSEVKWAVAKARELLDRGVPATEIAILAPDIGVYWPVLARYLEKEGILTDRALASPLQTFTEFQSWISRMQLGLGQLQYPQIEAGLSQELQQTHKSYDRIKSLLSNIYEKEQLARFDFDFEKWILPEKRSLSSDEFVVWSIQKLPSDLGDEALERIENALGLFVNQMPSGIKLACQSWVKIFTQIISLRDVKIKGSSSSEGLLCVDISSAEYASASYFIFMGLSEEGLKDKSEISLLSQDISSIETKTGFDVRENLGRNEFDVNWLSQIKAKEQVFLFSEADFMGQSLAPSSFWLKGADRYGTEDVKNTQTRWDSLMASQSQSFPKKGAVEVSPFGLGAIKSLSPSDVEAYFTCPFILASKKIFNLRDIPPVDLDLTHTESGTLIHAVLAQLLSDPLQLDLSESDIISVIEACRKTEQTVVAEIGFWEIQRKKLIDIAKRFLKNEKEMRRRFVEMRTVGRELKVEGYFDPSTGKFKKSKDNEEDILFKGKVDRVDMDASGNAIIIDYKSSDSSLYSFGYWISTGFLQVPIYAAMIEAGLSDLGPAPVVGGFYLNLKTMDRSYGFRRTEFAGTLFDLTGKAQGQVDEPEWKKFNQDLFEKLTLMVEQIKAGHFYANPRNPKECPQCQWKRLCRAPHLN